MPLPAKDPFSNTTLRVLFPENPPLLPESNQDYVQFNKEMRDWWFKVRTGLRRLQENQTATTSTGLSTTGVVAGTYGKND